MPETATNKRTAVVDGTTYEFSEAISGSAIERARPSVPAAKAGTLTTRTDDDTGTFTMASGHGFSTADLISVFWTGGKRHAMTATVTGDSVVLDGGTGTVLPSAATAITAMKPTEVAFSVTGSAVLLLVGSCEVPGYIRIMDNAGTPAQAALLTVTTADSYVWSSTNGVTNPLNAIVTTVARFTHGSTSAQTMTLLAIRT